MQITLQTWGARKPRVGKSGLQGTCLQGEGTGDVRWEVSVLTLSGYWVNTVEPSMAGRGWEATLNSLLCK